MRLLLHDINIPATTAMETLNINGRIIALNSGAKITDDSAGLLKIITGKFISLTSNILIILNSQSLQIYTINYFDYNIKKGLHTAF